MGSEPLFSQPYPNIFSMKKFIFYTLLIGAACALTTACGDKAAAGAESKAADATSSDAPETTVNPADLQDLTTETAQNKDDRNDILIGVKKELTNMKLPNEGFNIVSMKTAGDFAFVMLEIRNADGSEYQTSEPYEDCCHAEILFELAASQWVAVESDAFSTDVWYGCLWSQFGAPKELFNYNSETCP